MICTSIQNKTLEEILAILESGKVEMAEIRLDLCPLDLDEIESLFSLSDVPLIATCRLADLQAEEKLGKAIEAGAKYVDLEVEAPSWLGRNIRQACQKYGSVLIRSFHDFKDTPPKASLLSMLEKCRAYGGEVVKIVTTATLEADVQRVMSLYDEADPGTLVAFCMGEDGRESRLEALKKGAPFTYASLGEDDATAPGQWTTAEMIDAVYGGRQMLSAPCPLRMPASKSFAQRAIIFAALAEGTSTLSAYSPCGDNESAIAVARSLGATVEEKGSELRIKGIGALPGNLGIKELHTGESGLLTRLMIPILSVLSPEQVRVTGEKTLLKRPLSGAHDIMASFGVRLYPESNPNTSGARPAPLRSVDCCLPLSVGGPLIPGRAEVSGKGGSQLLSGLLAALPLCEERSTLYVTEPRSIPYLFITMDVLQKFGIRIGSEMEGDEEFLETNDWSRCTGMTFKIRGGQRYFPADFAIEGDWSGAAPFLVAGAIFGEVEVEGLDTESLQADISIMDILMDAGASMSQLEGKTPSTGALHVRRSPLNAFDTDLNNCPDLFPIVAVLAAFCPGESHILGVERLRHKETDRAAAIAEMLEQMGVPVDIVEDEMTIVGQSLTQRLLTGKLLKGGRFTSYGDHRMVMALKVAALGAESPVEIDDTSCVAKSFPGFIEMFDSLSGR